MIRLLLLFFCLTLGSAEEQPDRTEENTEESTETRFFTGSHEHLVAKAKRDQRPFVLAFHTTWCEPCKRMEALVYSNSKVGTFIKNHYYAMKVDAESEVYRDLAAKHYVQNYPTIIIFSAENEVLARLNGFQDEESLLVELRKYTAKGLDLRFSPFR